VERSRPATNDFSKRPGTVRQSGRRQQIGGVEGRLELLRQLADVSRSSRVRWIFGDAGFPVHEPQCASRSRRECSHFLQQAVDDPRIDGRLTDGLRTAIRMRDSGTRGRPLGESAKHASVSGPCDEFDRQWGN
jgi:hypothetical protein